MALILNIDTATPVCSVALANDGKILGYRESADGNSHSSVITPFIRDVVTGFGLALQDLDAVAVSMGPGSYTGLRIGVAAAKGLCYALDKPLIAVPTLQAIALGIRTRVTEPRSPEATFLLCPMIDARRMEVYTALYGSQAEEVRETKAEVIDGNSFSQFLAGHVIFFGGDGAGKCKGVLEANPNARFVEDLHSSAAYMTILSEERFNLGKLENLAYFEPFYLKDFVAGKPKVKGLH